MCGAAVGYCRPSTRYVQRWPRLRARPRPLPRTYPSAEVTRCAGGPKSAAVARSARRPGWSKPHQEYFVRGITRVFFSGIYSYP